VNWLHTLVALEVKYDTQGAFGNGRDGLLGFGDGGIFDTGQQRSVATAQEPTTLGEPRHSKSLFNQGVYGCIGHGIFGHKNE
jgi:hypothetical protein